MLGSTGAVNAAETQMTQMTRGPSQHTVAEFAAMKAKVEALAAAAAAAKADVPMASAEDVDATK